MQPSSEEIAKRMGDRLLLHETIKMNQLHVCSEKAPLCSLEFLRAVRKENVFLLNNDDVK